MTARLSARLSVLLYLGAVVAVTFIHDPRILAVLLAALLLAAGREAPRLLKRALIAVAAVNIAVSTGYIGISWWRGEPWADFVLLLNLRVVVLTVLTLWAAQRIDWRRASDFSPSLRFLGTVTWGQALTLRRLAVDYRLAQRSRTAGRPGLRARYRGAATQGAALMEKASASAEELAQGMRSRGVFDDRP